MLHHVARAVPGTVLFRTWTEGLALWHRLVASAPGLHALCVMPDHFHLLHDRDLRRELGAAMSGFARWRNHERGELGSVFDCQPEASVVGDAQKRRRSERYVHLNPCRAGLVDDPLAWPLSTWRDALGLAVSPARPRANDPSRLFAYVTADEHVAPGSDLPCNSYLAVDGSAAVRPVLAAVTELLRLPAAALRVRGPARTLAATVLSSRAGLPADEVAEVLALHPSTVRRLRPDQVPGVVQVVRVAGDRRFPGLYDQDLRLTPGWARYRGRR